MWRGSVALVLVLLVAAPAVLVRGDDGLGVVVDGTTLGSTPIVLHGTLAAAPSVTGACDPGACADVPLQLTVPDGFWSSVHGGLEIVVEAATAVPQVTLLDAAGNVAWTGKPTGAGGSLVPSGQPGPDSVAVVRDVASGAYTIRVTMQHAPTAFTLLVQRDYASQQPAQDLLPDLTVLPITHVSAVWSSTKIPGATCRPLEVLEAPTEQPMRCLRFDTTVGNLGPGRLFLTIPQQEAMQGLACNTSACPVPMAAQFTQVVERSDYSTSPYAAGPAIYHLGHNHYHIADFVLNTLYAVNADGTRGAQVRAGHKDGFCPINDGLIALAQASVEEPGVTACQLNGGDITIDLDSGYWDQYPANIDDQYVDITGIAPGTYELVTDVNSYHVVHESDPTNNEARVLVQIDASGARAIDGAAP